MNKFVLFAFLLFTENKTNSFVRSFFGRIAFEIYWPLEPSCWIRLNIPTNWFDYWWTSQRSDKIKSRNGTWLILPKNERTNEFVLFTFLLFTANKTNLIIRFFGESKARFRIYLTFNISSKFRMYNKACGQQKLWMKNTHCIQRS